MVASLQFSGSAGLPTLHGRVSCKSVFLGQASNTAAELHGLIHALRYITAVASCPGHAGIFGNEVADLLAKRGANGVSNTAFPPTEDSSHHSFPSTAPAIQNTPTPQPLPFKLSSRDICHENFSFPKKEDLEKFRSPNPETP